MLTSLKNLFGYTLHATDGEIGQVIDFYFDDHAWTIRYLVVDTGHWLPGRKVLIPPNCVGRPDSSAQAFPADLTREQVKDSPDIDTRKPISRQQEQSIYTHFGWDPYWASVGAIGGPLSFGPAISPGVPVHIGEQDEREEERRSERTDVQLDPSLRSAGEVFGYHIEASDGSIGYVEDFIIDDEHRTIRYLVLDTRNWLPGKRVLVAPSWVQDISWPQRRVYIELERECIKNAPLFDPVKPLTRQDEENLYRYYGKPGYWR